MFRFVAARTRLMGVDVLAPLGIHFVICCPCDLQPFVSSDGSRTNVGKHAARFHTQMSVRRHEGQSLHAHHSFGERLKLVDKEGGILSV